MKRNNYQSRKNILRDDKYLSIKDVAQKLFVDESTVRYWISKRNIEAYRSNGRWFILADSVKVFEQFIKFRNRQKNKRKKKKKIEVN
jgi:excisionase family DNA binding protein